MAEVAVETAKVRCSHGMGYARPTSSRPFLRIGSVPVLVAGDMAGNAIRLCPNYGPTMKPCTATLPLVSGRSRLVFANGAPLVLHRATGPTDGIPPGATSFSVRAPGQEFVFAEV